MHKIVGLVRRHTSEDLPVDLSSEESIILKANILHENVAKLLNEKQVWTQQAVWNKFGTSSVNLTNMVELSNATSPLLTEPKVAQYILAVNTMCGIDFSHHPEGSNYFAKKARKELETNFGTITHQALHSASMVSPQPRTSSKSAASVASPQYTVMYSETEQGSSDEGTSGGSTQHSGPTVTSHKRPRKRTKEKKKRARWTSARIAALVQAVEDHKEEQGWAGVAEALGNGLTSQQCFAKWYNVQARERRLKLRRKWTEEEVKTLQASVQTFQTHTAEGAEQIDWTEVGRALNRYPADCRNKYAALQGQQVKKGSSV